MIQAGYIETKAFPDNRGYFKELVNVAIPPFNGEFFVQQNISVNAKNVFRGMHYQFNNPQGKLVSVLKGSVVDFIVDLRRWSPNYGKVQQYTLRENDNRAVWVPQCFAHGFLSLEPDTIFTYSVFDNKRVEGDEYSIDPYSLTELRSTLGNFDVIISDKDKKGLPFEEAPKYE